MTLLSAGDVRGRVANCLYEVRELIPVEMCGEDMYRKVNNAKAIPVIQATFAFLEEIEMIMPGTGDVTQAMLVVSKLDRIGQQRLAIEEPPCV